MEKEKVKLGRSEERDKEEFEVLLILFLSVCGKFKIIEEREFGDFVFFKGDVIVSC